MGEAKDSSMQMLDKLQEADGIFCPNESSTQGMLLALRQAGLAGKKKFVGFDASPTLVEGLNKGEIDALVSQNPTKMGYEGVKTIVASIKGEKVEPRIDTGCQLITKENVDAPEIKQLLGTQ
jgi:ribose transport system substrate-binding protein